MSIEPNSRAIPTVREYMQHSISKFNAARERGDAATCERLSSSSLLFAHAYSRQVNYHIKRKGL